MTETSGQILKSDDVELEGRYRLEVVRDEFERVEPAQASDTAATPQAQIIENHADHAVVQVICSCGAKVNVRCDYAEAQTTQDA
ncbi:MAG: hypothetical protein ACYS14_02350 [Planctomycetota bacterium]|jgi:hypothetical protein